MMLVGCLFCILVIVFNLIEGLLLMALWNYIAPVFWASAPTLTFFQSICAILLINLIGSIVRSSLSK